MHGMKELTLFRKNTLTHPCFPGSTLAIKMEEYRTKEFRKSIFKKAPESLGYTGVLASLRKMIIWYPKKTHVYIDRKIHLGLRKNRVLSDVNLAKLMYRQLHSKGLNSIHTFKLDSASSHP